MPNVYDLLTTVAQFWETCREAVITNLGSEGNWTCGEVEALLEMLRVAGLDDDSDDLLRAHAAWGDTSQGGDCECEDLHHQLWVNAWGPCRGCGLVPEDTEG